jgi:S-adenosylmethionine:tRNA ribosyltransferase-isomerase
VHEPSTSHYQLLGAFAAEATLRAADATMAAANYRTHEFGDSVLLEFSKENSRPADHLFIEMIDRMPAFR